MSTPLAKLALATIAPYHDHFYLLPPDFDVLETERQTIDARGRAKAVVARVKKYKRRSPHCLPSGELVVSYRKPQTGDLPQLGYNAIGLHFEGRYVPFEKHAQLTDADKAWLFEQIHVRVEADRERRRERNLSLADVLYSIPGSTARNETDRNETEPAAAAAAASSSSSSSLF